MSAGDTTPGRRVFADADGDMPPMAPGDYGYDPRGRDHGTGANGNGWIACPPGGDAGLGNLGNHDVIEHEDGTITVSPSILVYPTHDHPKGWHGYLEHGVWREV